MKIHLTKETKSKLMLYGGFLIGLLILIYPLISQIVYDSSARNEATEFREQMYQMPSKEIDEKLKLAQAYNESLDPDLEWVDPFSEEERKAGQTNYAKMLEIKEKIGIVNIPRIRMELPIYAGTSEEVLQKAVGHLEGTSLPVGGKNTHSVITAHRGLPEKRLFTDLDKMQKKDIFWLETIAGKLYYEVDDIRTIEPTQTDAIKIDPDKDIVTLLTCTPYMVNSHRLLVTGHRIPAPRDDKVIKRSWLDKLWPYRWYILILAIVVLSLYLLYRSTNNQRPQNSG